MHPYLEQTNYAAESLIKAIFHEEQALADLERQRRTAETTISSCADGIEFFEMNPDFDDEGLGTLKRFEAKDAAFEIEQIDGLLPQIAQSVADKREATTALCGALLQIAKRGITDPDHPTVAPVTGRVIDGLHLSEIIWGGRNQSMHNEEVPRSAVAVRVFTTLERTRGPQFHPEPGRDLARAMVNLLGWSNLAAYVADMESILSAVPAENP